MARALGLTLRLAFASTALLAAELGAARDALAADCFEGISEANAQRVFDTLLKSSSGGSCVLESVSTEKSLMKIQWKKGGQLQEAVLVAPTSCVKVPSVRGKVLSTVVPYSVADACPAQVAALGVLVTGETLGGLVPVTGAIPVPDLVAPPRRWKRLVLPIAGGVAVLGAAGGFLVVRRRRAKRRQAPVAPAAAPQ